MTPREGLLLACKHFGSDVAPAKAIRFSPGALFCAKQLGQPTPQMAARIEAATNGKITHTMLRPRPDR